MADVDPKKRIAQFLRKLGPGSTHNERQTAFKKLEELMHSEGISWTDIGDAVEHHSDDGKYSEAEMKEFAQAVRAEGVEAGIKIGAARAQQHNGHLVLPPPSEMAEHCCQQLGQLTNNNERDFVNNTCTRIRRGARPKSPSVLGFLASVYIKTGGTTE